MSISLSLEPDGLDPTMGAAASIGEVVHYNVLEGLTRIEENGSKRPRVTKTWREAARLMLDRDHHPADEIHRDGYGYDEKVVENEPVAVVRPDAGDAVIFDSRNLHAVDEIGGAGRRVSLSFFLGASGRGPLQIWS